MYRYFVLVWSPDDPSACEAAGALRARLQPPWNTVLNTDGLVVFDQGGTRQGSDTWVLPDGAVLGRIFPRAPAGVIEATRQLVAAGPRVLLEHYWGRYVAVLRDPYTGTITVLRDPSAGMPCLIVQHERVHLVFSDLEDCTALGLGFSIDWSYVGARLAYPILASRDTALHGVSELQPGEALVFQRDMVWRELWWNPLAVAQRERIEDFATAVREIRASTLAAVHGWAAGREHIVLSLSGGLDSSIVLSCLKSAPGRPQITCLNYFGDSIPSDERRYARLMAQHAGVDLREHRITAADVDLRRVLQLRPSARPDSYLHELRTHGVETALAQEVGASAFFSGAGGDGIFFASNPDLPLMDYVFERGLGGVLQMALAVSMRTGKSVWGLLARVLATRLTGRATHPMRLIEPSLHSVVSPDFQTLAAHDSRFQPLWLTSDLARRAAPGVLRHALSVSVATAFYSAFERSRPEYVDPLLSSVLVETALRIPSYVLMQGAQDRVVARQAFAADLPPQISQRFDKGVANDSFRDMLDDNLEFVREIMLDGSLATRGLLNRSKLETYLTRGKSADVQYTEILVNYFCTQAWLNRWEH